MSRLVATLLIPIIIATGCTPKADTTAPASEGIADSVPVPNNNNISIDDYKAVLDTLPKEPTSSLKGLLLFRNFISSTATTNDSLFKTYLQFQARLIEDMNANLPEHPHFEAIESLIWADTTKHKKEGKDYEAQLRRNGLVLKATEGVSYIDRDPHFIKPYFYEHVTSDTRKFFDQLSKETTEGFSDDGGLSISVHDLADRVGFWDEFISTSQAKLFLDEAHSRRDVYRYFLLAGMDNTPAFDYDTGTHTSEFSNALHHYLDTYPSTESANIIREYLALLKESDYKMNDRAQKFLEKYQ